MGFRDDEIHYNHFPKRTGCLKGLENRGHEHLLTGRLLLCVMTANKA